MLVRIERFPGTRSLVNELFDFERDIDSMFGRFLGTTARPAVRTYPALDVAEHENETVVVAEVPGLNKKDIKISVLDGVLTISGIRKERVLPEKSSWVRNEVGTGEFSRSIRLPHEVNTSSISAEMENGVLRIVLPKAEAAKPREISIR
ncbi:MAG: Hsp20/alpha crystallin family protein [Ignavibacteria bacterium]|nr:Hsp20/alpha crystallin family protein [Ignavibacteria bacterium]